MSTTYTSVIIDDDDYDYDKITIKVMMFTTAFSKSLLGPLRFGSVGVDFGDVLLTRALLAATRAPLFEKNTHIRRIGTNFFKKKNE